MQDRNSPQVDLEKLLIGVLNSSLDGIMAFEAVRDDRGEIVDFKFVVVNAAAERIVNRDASDLVGRRLLRELPGNQADGLFDSYVKVVETGEPYRSEHHYAHDGLNHWFRISATRCGDGFTVTFADITDSKADDERFRVLFEQSTDAHFLYDEGGIIDCNQAAVEMLGYDRKDEILRIHPATLSPEFQPDGSRSCDKKEKIEKSLLETGFDRFDWVHLRKDGGEFPVEVTLCTVQLTGKDAVLGVWHDQSERIQNEQEVRRTAEHLAEAQALAKLGSWAWTPATNRIVWSDETKRIFGVPVDQPAPDFENHQKQIHPDDLAHWQSVVEKALGDHQSYVMKFRAVLPDGEVRVIEGRGRCELDTDGSVRRMYGTVQDITEAEAAQSELQKLSMVASRTDDGVIVTDAAGRIEWINRAFSKITGYRIDEIRGKKPGAVLQGPGTDPEAVARIRNNLAKGHGFRETLLNYHKSGEAFWNEVEVQPIRDERGEIVNYMAIERNVTERFKQQRVLEEHRNRLEFALNTSRTGLWDWDVKTGETYFSDSWYTMLGYEPGELPMEVQSWIDITEPGDLERAKAALEAYFEGKTDRYVCEQRVRNKAGQWQWILDVGQAVERDAEGNVLRMIGLHLDIEQQKRAQAALSEARDHAQQANAAKSAFIANMSHEIRTPMNAILGYADLLLDVDQTEADKRNHANTIQRNGRHLMALLNDVLDISKIEAGRMSVEQVVCTPSQLFADVITLMMPKAIEKGIDLQFEEANTLPQRITTDPTRIKQVLLNLIGNAIKFTSEGSVRVLAHHQPAEDGSIRLTCDVIDTGIGIEEQQLAKLFKPFSQADESTTRRFGGTGLGLAISHNLCELLGGDLTCESTPGIGSIFTARFRVGAVEPSQNKKVPQSPIPSAAKSDLAGIRVLVVEDAPDNMRLLSHYLTRAQAEFTAAENGALGRDAALSVPFDVVLMDMQMPVLDGYEATRQLREAGYDRPIIALTAHASAVDRDKCLEAGCSDYLTKPVNRQQLIRLIMSHTAACVDGGAGI